MAGPMMFAGTSAALALLVPLPVMQESGPPAAQIEVVQAERDGHARLTVPVRIGENGTFRFLIDTGAERTVLSRDVANRLGLVPNGSAILMGVAGSQRVELVEVDEIGLGRRSFTSLSAPLLENHHIGADGIIGLDSLQGQRVLLDFGHNRIAVDDARTLGGNAGYEIVVKARRRSGQLIMTNALVGGVRTDIIIDTGAETSIGNLALQRALAMRDRVSPATLISVTGQEVVADSGRVSTIKVGRIVLNDTLLAFTDAPPFRQLGLHRRPAILLGMNQLRLFKRIAIDFSTRRIFFDLPDDARDHISRD